MNYPATVRFTLKEIQLVFHKYSDLPQGVFFRLSFKKAKYTRQDEEHVLLHILKNVKLHLLLLCFLEAGERKSVVVLG